MRKKNPFRETIAFLESRTGMSWDEARSRAAVKGDRDWWSSLVYWPPYAEQAIARAFGVSRAEVAEALRRAGAGVTMVWVRTDQPGLSGITRVVDADPDEPRQVEQPPVSNLTEEHYTRKKRLLRFLGEGG